MPLLVGALKGEPFYSLSTLSFVATITELTATRAKTVAQGALFRCKRRPRFVVGNCKLFQRLSRAGFRHTAGLLNGVFEIPPKSTVKRCHLDCFS